MKYVTKNKKGDSIKLFMILMFIRDLLKIHLLLKDLKMKRKPINYLGSLKARNHLRSQFIHSFRKI